MLDNLSIEKGMNALAKVDPELALAYDLIGLPPNRTREKGFATLLAILVSQQISTKVAKIILQRVNSLLTDLTAKNFLDLTPEDLRQAGLSYRKIEYAQTLARALVKGDLDLKALDTMGNDLAVKAITHLPGFGVWSAQIYLLFALQREDIMPANDLALQVAFGKIKNLTNKPSSKALRTHTGHWAPYRSVGALFLWYFYQNIPSI